MRRPALGAETQREAWARRNRVSENPRLPPAAELMARLARRRRNQVLERLREGRGK